MVKNKRQMESTNIYKYRIKKHWKLNSVGNKHFIFFPQYKSKIYGWRYINDYYDNAESSLIPNNDIIAILIFGTIIACVGVIILCT